MNWKHSIQKRRIVDKTNMRKMIIQLCNQWDGMLNGDDEDSVKVDKMKKRLIQFKEWAEEFKDDEDIKW